MATQVQLRGGTTTEHDSFTGASREVTVDTTKKTIVVHDGSTAGGIPLAKESGSTFTNVDINSGTIDGVTIGGASAGAITGTTITGTSFVTSGNMTFGDSDKAIFGAGNDLQIYHDGSNTYIDESAGVGNLIIKGANVQFHTPTSEIYLAFANNGAVTAYYDNAAKLATTATGINVTGTVTADGLTVDGSLGSFAVQASGAELHFSRNENNDILANGGTSASFTIGANNNLTLKTGATLTQRLQIANNGDISFYEPTGTTPKLFWDASTERLGIGTASPDELLHLAASSGATIRFESTTTGATTGDIFGAIEFETQDASSAGIKAKIDAYSEGGVGNTALRLFTGDTTGLYQRLNIASNGDISFYEPTGVTSKFFWDASAGSLLIGQADIPTGLGASNTKLIMGNSEDGPEFVAYNSDNSIALGDKIGAYLFGNDDNNATEDHFAGMWAKSAGTTGSMDIHFAAGKSNYEDDLPHMTIDYSGRLLIGSTSSVANNTGLQVNGTDFQGSSIAASRFSNDASSTHIIGQKSRSGTIGNNTVVQSGDIILRVGGYASDGVDMATPVGHIDFVVDGIPGSNDMPGRIVFYTTSDGSNLSTERIRLDSSGNLLLGTTSASGASAPDNSSSSSNDGIRLSPSGFIGLGAYQQPSAYFNRMGNDGDIVEFNKDGSPVGAIGTFNGNAYFGNGDTGIRPNSTTDTIYPVSVSAAGAARDAAISFGDAGTRFKDLYLSGSVYLGGTTSANALDDYEEGTWAPSVGGTATYNAGNYGRYVKVGNIVSLQFCINIASIGTGSATSVTNLPFTSENIGNVQTGCVSYFANLNTSTNFIAFYVNNNATSITFVGNTGNTATVSLNGFSIFQSGTEVFGAVTYRTA